MHGPEFGSGYLEVVNLELISSPWRAPPHRLPSPTSRVPDSVSLGWSSRICISEEVLGDADVLVQGPHFENWGYPGSILCQLGLWTLEALVIRRMCSLHFYCAPSIKNQTKTKPKKLLTIPQIYAFRKLYMCVIVNHILNLSEA